MSDTTIPKPPTEQLVTPGLLQQALYTRTITTTAFGGMRDPSRIWDTMVRGDSLAIPLYRELEDKDDDVSAALDELKLSVLEREWSIAPGDDSQAALDAAGFATGEFNRLDVESTFDDMLDAAPYGFSVSEVMYDTSMGQASLLSIDDCPQELFLFGSRYAPQVGQLELLSSVGSSDGTPVPEEKFLVFSYRGRSRSRVGRPLLQRAFWPSWFKRQILGLWLKTGEKSNGTALARYAKGASASEIALALEAAEALVDGVAFAAPEGMIIEIELLKAAQNRNPELYEKLFTQMQYSIARAIKGQTLTSFGNEGGHGSRSQGQTHQETFDKRSISLAKKHARVVNQQLLYRLHVWNFGPNVPAPVFSWDTAEEVDLVQKATLFTQARALNIPIGMHWAAAQLQIPPVAEGDTPLPPPAVGAPQVQPPASVFAEDSDAARQAHRDQAQLDELVGQLREHSLSLFHTRVAEVADNLLPDKG